MSDELDLPDVPLSTFYLGEYIRVLMHGARNKDGVSDVAVNAENFYWLEQYNLVERYSWKYRVTELGRRYLELLLVHRSLLENADGYG